MFESAKLYLYGAAAAMLLGLVLFAGWQYDRAEDVQAQLQASQQATANVQAAVTQLQAGVDASNKAIADMQPLLDRAANRAASVRERVITLGNDNAQIRSWLDTTLPPGGCLLDNTCADETAAIAASIGSTPGAMPASAPSGKQNKP